MTRENGSYKCEICGNVVEILKTGEGDLYCCGEAMKLQSMKWDKE